MNNISLRVAFCIAAILLSFSVSKSQVWESLADCNPPNPFPVMAAVDGKIYLLSGTQGSPVATRVYDPATNTWEDKAPIPEGCIYSSGDAVDGKIYVMGGGQSNQKQDNHYIYDPATDTWKEGAPLLTPRMYHSSAVVDGKIYLIGGQNGDGTTEWYFDQYDPATDRWTRKDNTPHAEAWYCGAVGIGTSFYRIAGGRWNVPSSWFDIYDSETEMWKVMDPFPITLHAPAAVAFNGRILVMGGYNNEQKTDAIYMYYPSSNLWTPTLTRLPEAMAYHKAVAMGNYVYVYSKSEDGKVGRLWRYKFGTTDVEDLYEPELSIHVFPNPSSGMFTLRSPEDMHHTPDVIVRNVFGQEVPASIDYSNGNGYLNVDVLSTVSGLYYVTVKAGHQSVTKTVVVR
jgi:N-acetylneuraminic acid mutarotase